MLEYLNSIGLGYKEETYEYALYNEPILYDNDTREFDIPEEDEKIMFFEDKPKVKTYIFIRESFFNVLYNYFKNKNKIIIYITPEMHITAEHEYYNSQNIELSDMNIEYKKTINRNAINESFITESKYNKYIASYLAKELITQLNSHNNELSECCLLLFDNFKYPIIDNLLLKINSQYSFDLIYPMFKNMWPIIHNNNSLYKNAKKALHNYIRKIKAASKIFKLSMGFDFKAFVQIVRCYFSQYFTSDEEIVSCCTKWFNESDLPLDKSFKAIPINKAFLTANTVIMQNIKDIDFD